VSYKKKKKFVQPLRGRRRRKWWVSIPERDGKTSHVGDGEGEVEERVMIGGDKRMRMVENEVWVLVRG
jgi:hypothetical protein